MISKLSGTALAATGLSLVACMLLSAAPASAGPVTPADSQYFQFLQSHGVPVDQPDVLKATAAEICGGLDDGRTFTEVGVALMQRGADPHTATIQVFGAVDAYCPVNANQLNVVQLPAARLV